MPTHPMVRSARRALAAVLVVAGVLTASQGLLAHPIHSTFIELAARPDGAIAITVRVFSDDLAGALSRRAGVAIAASASTSVAEASVFSYVAASVSLATADGRAIPLEGETVRKAGDLVWITMVGRGVSTLSRLRVHDRMLFDLYDDQVNIVQASYGTRRESVLFTKGDTPKQLP